MYAVLYLHCFRYYPKLQVCVPFTPVTGNRLLVAPGPEAPLVTKALAQTLVTLTGNTLATACIQAYVHVHVSYKRCGMQLGSFSFALLVLP